MQPQPDDPSLNSYQNTEPVEPEAPSSPPIPSGIYPTPKSQYSTAPEEKNVDLNSNKENVINIIISRRRSAKLCAWMGAVFCVVAEILQVGSKGNGRLVTLYVCLFLSAYGALLYFINNSNLKQLHPWYRACNMIFYLIPAYMMIIEMILVPFRILANLTDFMNPKSYFNLRSAAKLEYIGRAQADIYFGYRSYQKWLPQAKYVQSYF
jgi:hypothetical protein